MQEEEGKSVGISAEFNDAEVNNMLVEKGIPLYLKYD